LKFSEAWGTGSGFAGGFGEQLARKGRNASERRRTQRPDE
jgi:hypothetical protein